MMTTRILCFKRRIFLILLEKFYNSDTLVIIITNMFNFLNKDKKPENIKQVLDLIKKMGAKIESLEKEIETLKEESNFAVKKVGMIRFNPFSKVGGDMSFSIALLDSNNSGAVITSLFSQQGNRVYGKPVENGVSEYTLSDEEKKAIEKAIQKT